MTRWIYFSIILILNVSIDSSPISMRINSDKGLEKKLSVCENFESAQFLFKEEDFVKSSIEIYKSMNIQAEKNSNSLKKQAECIRNLTLSKEEIKKFDEGIENAEEELGEILESQNRWLRAFVIKNQASSQDGNLISSFYIAKKDIYKIIIKQFKKIISPQISKSDRESIEREIDSLYISSIRLHYDFYLSVSPDFRKQIFEFSQQ